MKSSAIIRDSFSTGMHQRRLPHEANIIIFSSKCVWYS